MSTTDISSENSCVKAYDGIIPEPRKPINSGKPLMPEKCATPDTQESKPNFFAFDFLIYFKISLLGQRKKLKVSHIFQSPKATEQERAAETKILDIVTQVTEDDKLRKFSGIFSVVYLILNK